MDGALPVPDAETSDPGLAPPVMLWSGGFFILFIDLTRFSCIADTHAPVRV